MRYYVCEKENGELYVQGAEGFTPKKAICQLFDTSLINKKIKIIDEVKTDPLTQEPIYKVDPMTQETLLDENGDPVPVTKKVAVLDEAAQTDYETELAEAQAEQAVVNAVRGAMSFGNKLMTEFIVENVKMGITQDGMTEIVLDAMSGVMNALQAGSLYLAIDRIKAIPVESKDAKYITDERLLTYVNKIEEYLGFPLSGEL